MDRRIIAGVRAKRMVAAAGLVVVAVSGAAAQRVADPALAGLERACTASPEDLRTCAEYRQRIIASGEYDRAIKLFERMASAKGAGPNAQISLALAYVDKVPVASPFRRIFIGHDAMRAMSRAIEREPSPVTYYIRGLIALFYPDAIFHHAREGIADLERARGLLAGVAPHPSHARVYMSLGDGYWKIHDLTRAVPIWKEGLSRFPSDANLRARLENRGEDLNRLVDRALDPAYRVDTSLQELYAAVPAS